jgi:hypothetical protein
MRAEVYIILGSIVETIVNVLMFTHGPHLKEHLNGAWDNLSIREVGVSILENKYYNYLNYIVLI